MAAPERHEADAAFIAAANPAAVLELVQRLRAAESAMRDDGTIAREIDDWRQQNRQLATSLVAVERRAEKAGAIVRDLALAKVTTDGPEARCIFCQARVVEGHITHVAECLWGLAVEAKP